MPSITSLKEWYGSTDRDGFNPYRKGDILVVNQPLNFHEVGEVVVMVGADQLYAGDMGTYWVRIEGKPGHYCWTDFDRATPEQIAAALNPRAAS